MSDHVHAMPPEQMASSMTTACIHDWRLIDMSQEGPDGAVCRWYCTRCRLIDTRVQPTKELLAA